MDAEHFDHIRWWNEIPFIKIVKLSDSHTNSRSVFRICDVTYITQVEKDKTSETCEKIALALQSAKN